jgi:hypothetical protein
VLRAASYYSALFVDAGAAEDSGGQLVALRGEGTAVLLRARLAEALAVEERAAVSSTDRLLADAAVGAQTKGPLPRGEWVVCDV